MKYTYTITQSALTIDSGFVVDPSWCEVTTSHIYVDEIEQEFVSHDPILNQITIFKDDDLLSTLIAPPYEEVILVTLQAESGGIQEESIIEIKLKNPCLDPDYT